MKKVVSAKTTPSTWCFLTTGCQLPSPTEQSINQCLRYWFLKLAWWTDRITSRIKSVEVVRKWWVIVRIQPSKTSSCRFKIFFEWWEMLIPDQQSVFELVGRYESFRLFFVHLLSTWQRRRENGNKYEVHGLLGCSASLLPGILEWRGIHWRKMDTWTGSNKLKKCLDFVTLARRANPYCQCIWWWW